MRSRFSERPIATGALILATVVWGYTFVMNQDILKSLNALSLMTWRFGIASAILLSVRPRALLRLDRDDVVHGLILGMFLGLGYVGQLVGLTSTTATASGFITGLFVVFAPLIGAVALRQRIPVVAWLAVALTCVGLALLALRGWHMGVGELLTLGCAVMFACHIVGLGEWSTHRNAYGLTTLQILVVFLMSLMTSALHGGIARPPTARMWWDIVFLAVFATCLAYFAQTWAQSKLNPTRTAIILTMEPVFSGFAGVTIGTDTLTARMVVGAACILFAMYLVELGPRQSKEGTIPHLEP